MRSFVFLSVLATAVLLMSGPAKASHDGASTPCCQASGGFACNETATPTDPNGCTEADPTAQGSCLGGTLDPMRGGPNGCFCTQATGNLSCFAGQYVALPASPEECAAAAVAACCAAGACHTVAP